MFGIDFSEIVVIMVVALIVLGPERLPKVARTMGQWWGRMQRYINRIKMDVSASMELEELREIERRVKAEKDALERSVSQAGADIEQEAEKLGKGIAAPDQTPAPPITEPPAVTRELPPDAR